MPDETPIPETTLATIPANPAAVVPPETPAEMTVVARNPQEMMVAQARLVSWAIAKVAECREALAEMEANLAAAQKMKWRVEPLKRAVRDCSRRVTFYEKVKQALDAGYVIIPNFECDVFAIRTDRLTPPHKDAVGAGTRHADVSEVEAPSIPAGKGQYVADEAQTSHMTYEAEPWHDGETHAAGGKKFQTRTWASAFREVDFPFAFARSAIMTATQEAMALRLFDEIAVSPDRKGVGGAGLHRKGDPMVIGRIVLPKKSTYQERPMISFLITWFVDTRALP